MNTKWFEEFANKKHLKIELDPCGDPWILGMYGHLSIYADNMIAIHLERKGDAVAKKVLLKAKPDTVVCECDTELIVAVNIKNRKYITKAIKILEVPARKSRISEAEREKRRERMIKLRGKHLKAKNKGRDIA